jgi:hypothetical protein
MFYDSIGIAKIALKSNKLLEFYITWEYFKAFSGVNF